MNRRHGYLCMQTAFKKYIPCTEITGSRTANVHVYTTNSLPSAGAVISSSDAGNQLCGVFAGPGTEGQEIEVRCAPGVRGRYVVVQIMGIQYLTVCEVEVFGGKKQSILML